MLRTMRADFKKYSWTLWLVIIAFLGGFAFTDIFRGEARSKTDLIFVGDRVVSAKKYQEQLMRTLQYYESQFKNNFNKGMISQLRIPEQTLQELINSTILQKEAKKLGIKASNEELKQKIMTHPYAQKDGKFVGIKEYEMRMRYARIDVKEFEKELKDQIIMEKYMKLITSGLVIDEDTLREEYKNEKDNAEIDYIVLRPDIIKDSVEVSDTELGEYYAAHKENFKSQEKRAGYVIALKSEDYKKEVTITDKELFDYFKANKSQFVDPEKTKVSRILLKYDENNRNEIEKQADKLHAELTKENFAQKAKELSQDDKAKDGGDYGYFEWQRFTKQETTIIKSMEENQIFSPVVTDQGFSILMVTEKKSRTQKEFATVKPMIKDRLEKQQLDLLLTKKLRGYYNKLKDKANIKDEAEKLGLQVIDTGSLGQGDTIKEVDASGTLLRQLFSMQEKEVSTPIMYPQGMAILQLHKIEPPQIQPLDKVKDKVKTEVVNNKKIKLLLTKAHSIKNELNRLQKKENIEAFLKKNELEAKSATYRRGNRIAYMEAKKGLDEQIFSLEENNYSDPIELKSEVVMVKVNKKTISSDEDFKKEKAEFYQQKLQQRRSSYFASFIYNIREKYDVRINEKLFLEVKDYILSRFN